MEGLKPGDLKLHHLQWGACGGQVINGVPAQAYPTVDGRMHPVVISPAPYSVIGLAGLPRWQDLDFDTKVRPPPPLPACGKRATRWEEPGRTAPSWRRRQIKAMTQPGVMVKISLIAKNLRTPGCCLITSVFPIPWPLQTPGRSRCTRLS